MQFLFLSSAPPCEAKGEKEKRKGRHEED